MDGTADSAQSIVAKPAGKRLLKNSGNVYKVEITNAKFTDRVITDIAAPAGTGNPPIFGAIDIEEDLQIWEYDSFKQTIKNKNTGLYACPESEDKGARIIEKKQAYVWDVEDQDGGLHSIGLPNTKLFWALAAGDNYTFVTLQASTVDDNTWKWVFNKV